MSVRGLPRNLDFEVYGLSALFSGLRVLGLWDEDQPPHPTRTVYRVTTEHFDLETRASISVHTVGKFGRHGFPEAAGSALQHATWKAEWCEPGIGMSLDTLEILSLSDDRKAPQWGRTRLIAAGAGMDAYFHRVGKAWAVAVELDDIVIGVSGCRAEPGDYELVPIADLTRYARRWPRLESRSEGTSELIAPPGAWG